MSAAPLATKGVTGGKSSDERNRAVDLVTGKATQEYFFDPSLLLPGNYDSSSSTIIHNTNTAKTPSKVGSSSSSQQSRDAKDTLFFFQSKYLFVPCTIIKPLNDDKENPPLLTTTVPLIPPSPAPPTSPPPPPPTPPPQPTNGPNNNGKKKKKKKGKGGGQANVSNVTTSMPSTSGAVVAVSNNSNATTATTMNSPNLPYPGPTLVKTTDGALHKISDSTRLIPLHSPADYDGVADILQLPSVSEASLLHTLRLRYRRDEVYTAAGQILISINPYKAITSAAVGGGSIYSEQQMMIYRQRGWTEKPPHLFQVADRAYSALMESVRSAAAPGSSDDLTEDESDVGVVDLQQQQPTTARHHHQFPPGRVRNQSIIISGESGAGKTEATKIIMTFLAKITRKKGESMIEALADRVLSSNPLLETFGNAQTLRNNNSSRFGKFIHIYFNCVSGAIAGASISNYLLEKTRITHQIEGERNYHIFYQLLSGAPDDDNNSMVNDLGLESGVESFRYLVSKSQVSQADATAFRETIACLTSIGLSKEEQRSVLGMAAAVLHLGNVQFEEGECETAKVSVGSIPSLNKACELLGINVDKMSEAVLTKIIVVNGKPIHKPQNVALAEDKRDALAKLTYSCLFLWLVNCINEKLHETSLGSESKQQSADKKGFIGVLDIYGFECFETNGFEQLLINYCNEMLQRHFNRHLFEVEQALYATEGVDWSYITFNDNRPCLELIEGGGGGSIGILNALDDAWSGMGTTSKKDEKFAKHLHAKFGGETNSHPNFVSSKLGNDREFAIVHYAGGVKYTVDGFVEKNMETMSNELRELGEESTVLLAKKVYASINGADTSLSSTSTRSSIRGVSVGSQFRTSLHSLVADLERTQPHYIRCIKPNLTKSAGSFMAGEVLKQLRYSGMMEAIRIRQDGYALREEHESFFDRFSVLLNPDDIPKGKDAGIVQLVQTLSNRLGVSDADWQLGHSKIFLRRELSDKLERMAKLRIHSAARTLTRFGIKVARRRAAVFISTFVRFQLRRMEAKRVHKAASKISGLARRIKQRRAYKSALVAVVRIQTLQRRVCSVHRVRKMRDPFYDLTFRDCQKLLKLEEENLDRAVKEKNFNRAKELEAKIIAIGAAVETKRPITRSVVDRKIATIKMQLEDSVKRQAFDECGPLQDQLDELMLKQADLPTIDELRMAVSAAESSMMQAAKNRDFEGAAAAQIEAEKAKQRLLDTLAADGEFSDTKGNLVDEKEIHNEVSQSERILDATAKEIPDVISSTVPTVPTITLANGESVSFSSRLDLEKTISESTATVTKLVDEKNFKKAAAIQADLDAMAKLRDHLPSMIELQQRLDSNTMELEAAVSSKQFAKADELQQARLEIIRLLEIEKAVGPLHTSEDNIDQKTDSSIAPTTNVKPVAISHSTGIPSTVNSAAPRLAMVNRNDTSTSKSMPTSSGVRVVRGDASTVNSFTTKASTSFSTADVQRLGSSIGPPPYKPVAPTTLEVHRLVASLRPATPVIGRFGETVLSVSERLASNRSNACIVVDDNGELAGILTDTDITRRVVAKFIDPDITDVALVMTPSPTCVATTDSAMDALTVMVENHFRHLPVVNQESSVVGILDITKCLNDAIAKLERNHGRSADSAEEVVRQVISKQAVKGIHAPSLQALLGTLMAEAFGGRSMPTLRSLLTSKPSTAVSPDTSIREAGVLMAESRKAAMVVKDGQLSGVFTFKDMMTRVVAKQLPVDSTKVAEVMTPNPECISPDETVLEALQVMHDQRFLTLPVCERDGTVVGLVDVMDVIYGCGGTEGWRSIFSSAMGLQDDSSSVGPTSSTGPKSEVQAVPKQPWPTSTSVCGASSVLSGAGKRDKSVAKLRPSAPCLSGTDDSILSVVQLLKNKRASASLIVNTDGSLAGIVTDTDITRRVVAKFVNPASTEVSTVMTSNPTVVSVSALAADALTTMVENHFRHLPVVDDDGSVVGVLDIAKCLNDAIAKLEKSKERSAAVAEDTMKQAIMDRGGDSSHATAMLALLENLLSQSFGDKKVPTLRSLLAGKPRSLVSPNSSIQDAGIVMAETRKAALIVDEGKLVGIFSFKDCMTRAVAMEIPLETTPVSAVMTPNPEFVSPETNVLEALQVMHDQRFLTLPVCDDDGTVVGVVDVMDVIYGCGGADGWRSIFNSSMDLEDLSDSTSIISKPRGSAPLQRSQVVKAPALAQVVSGIPSNIPSTLEFIDGDAEASFTGSTIGDERGVSKLLSPEDASGSQGLDSGFRLVVFKVQCPSGNTHRIRCEATVKDLVAAISSKTSISASCMRIEYEDDEGDIVVVSSDDDVAEAFNLARKAGKKLAKLTVKEVTAKPKTPATAIIGGGLTAAAVLGAVVMVWLRPRK